MPVLLLAVGLAWVWIAAIAAVAWMLSHPPRRTYAWAVARGLPGDPRELSAPLAFESWTFEFRGLMLPVWEIAGGDPSGPCIIITPGWGDSRVGALVRVPALAPHASRLILWDPPGLGDAPGTCRLGTREARALAALVTHARDGDPRTPVVLYGWSLGAGVSIEVAAGLDGIAGVIAESPYRLASTPARNVLIARGMPWRMVLPPAMALLWTLWTGRPRDPRFDRARHAARVPCPILVLHGELDAVAPIADGREIAAAAPNARLECIAGAGHNNLWTDYAARSAAAVREFLTSLAARAPSPPAPTLPA